MDYAAINRILDALTCATTIPTLERGELERQLHACACEGCKSCENPQTCDDCYWCGCPRCERDIDEYDGLVCAWPIHSYRDRIDAINAKLYDTLCHAVLPLSSWMPLLSSKFVERYCCPPTSPTSPTNHDVNYHILRLLAGCNTVVFRN